MKFSTYAILTPGYKQLLLLFNAIFKFVPLKENRQSFA